MDIGTVGRGRAGMAALRSRAGRGVDVPGARVRVARGEQGSGAHDTSAVRRD